jgi:hypothetical protein
LTGARPEAPKGHAFQSRRIPETARQRKLSGLFAFRTDMATNPMMQSPMGQEQEGPAEEAMPGEEADGGTELVIKVGADGSISVYKEAGEDESAEQTAQQVSDIGQALAWCLKEFKALNAGGGDAQSQFQAGFGAETKPQRMIG